MEKKVIIGIVVVIVILALIVVGGFVYNNRISCKGEADCFEKHYGVCKKYTGTMEKRSGAIVDFAGTVTSTWEILGERLGDKCKVHITINGVSNTNENWALGREATCFLPSDPDDFNGQNPIDFLQENCEGNFVTGAVNHCYVAGGQNSDPFTKCDGPKEIEETPLVIEPRPEIDKENLCLRMEDTERYILECYDNLQAIYDAFDQNLDSCQGETLSDADKEDCEEMLEKYDDYDSFYVGWHSMILDYVKKGKIELKPDTF